VRLTYDRLQTLAKREVIERRIIRANFAGRSVGLPVYQILGAYRHRVLAYASSQHLKTVDAFTADVERAKAEGFRAYKIHPPFLPGRRS
jgi:L-alanine-DL-glutamate epimerase-like enolase superfamily enzyme